MKGRDRRPDRERLLRNAHIRRSSHHEVWRRCGRARRGLERPLRQVSALPAQGAGQRSERRLDLADGTAMTPLLSLVWGLGGNARPLRFLAAHTRPIVLGRPAAYLGCTTCLTCTTQSCLILFRVAVIVAVSKSARVRWRARLGCCAHLSPWSWLSCSSRSVRWSRDCKAMGVLGREYLNKAKGGAEAGILRRGPPCVLLTQETQDPSPS